MKDILHSDSNNSNKFRISPSSENFILNVIIILLSVAIIFMGLSFYKKVAHSSQAENLKEDNSKPLAKIQVEVLNGCGIGGVADRFTDYLRNNNFDVVQMGNYISYDIEKTIVIDRTGNMAKAYKVAAALGVDRKNVIQQINKNYFLDVSIIIGKDFNNLKPYQNQ